MLGGEARHHLNYVESPFSRSTSNTPTLLAGPRDTDEIVRFSSFRSYTHTYIHADPLTRTHTLTYTDKTSIIYLCFILYYYYYNYYYHHYYYYYYFNNNNNDNNDNNNNNNNNTSISV